MNEENIDKLTALINDKTIKAVLLDMDGVLYNSMPIHAYAWTTTLRHFGLPFKEEEAYLCEGRTGASTINIVANRVWKRNATIKEIEDIYAYKTSLFDNYKEAEPMTGAREVLDCIDKLKLGKVLVTGSGQKALIGRLQKHFPDNFTPNNMITAFDVVHGKPDPEPYIKGLKKACNGIGLSASQAIVVENAPLGVRSAKAAGIFTVAVNTGKLTDQVLFEEGCDVLFHSMLELAEFLNSLCK